MIRLLCLLLCCVLCSCAPGTRTALPVLQPLEGRAWGDNECRALFVSGNWQFVHSITFTAGGSPEVTLMGVTVLHDTAVKSVLMGVEGFVLFEAEENDQGEITVARALPPFDSARFAKGLLDDVRMLFYEPEMDKKSVLETGEQMPVCRYHMENRTTDVMTTGKGWTQIMQYDREGRLVKSSTASEHRQQEGSFFPEKIEIKSYGVQGYTLQLQLLSADKI